MMMLVGVSGVSHVKAALRAAAGLILHLHGCVLNVILVMQKFLNTIQQGVVIVRWDDLDVQRHHRFFSDQPDVDMMHVADFGHRAA